MADDDATRVILDHPAARENPDEHQRAGINLALAALATAAHSGDPNLAMPGLTALLVAREERWSSFLRGAAGLASRGRHGRSRQRRGPVQLALVGTATVTKINGIAVDEASRGQGIGTALIGLCLALYFQLDYILAYGQFPGRLWP